MYTVYNCPNEMAWFRMSNGAFLIYTLRRRAREPIMRSNGLCFLENRSADLDWLLCAARAATRLFKVKNSVNQNLLIENRFGGFMIPFSSHTLSVKISWSKKFPRITILIQNSAARASISIRHPSMQVFESRPPILGNYAFICICIWSIMIIIVIG